jgi:hypothetical protein
MAMVLARQGIMNRRVPHTLPRGPWPPWPSSRSKGAKGAKKAMYSMVGGVGTLKIEAGIGADGYPFAVERKVDAAKFTLGVRRDV